MLIEILYHQPAANADGYVLARRLVKDEDVVTLDPKPGDPSLSVLRVQGGASQFVPGVSDLTLHESFAAFRDRFASSSGSTRVLTKPLDSDENTGVA